MGTAGFARDLVSGYNRVPAPPPKITAATDFVFVTALALGRSAAFVAAASPRIVIARLRDATDEDDAETARPRLREKQKKQKSKRVSQSQSRSNSARLDAARANDRSMHASRARSTDRPPARASPSPRFERYRRVRSSVRSSIRRARTNDECIVRHPIECTHRPRSFVRAFFRRRDARSKRTSRTTRILSSTSRTPSSSRTSSASSSRGVD